MAGLGRRALALRDTMRNLRDVSQIMWHNVTRLMVRGETTVALDALSIDILRSSESFVQMTVPWYKRAYTYCCCTLEYYACYCCTRDRMKSKKRRVSV